MRTRLLLALLLMSVLTADAGPPSATPEVPRDLVVRDYKPHVTLAWTCDRAPTSGFEVERAIVAGVRTPKPDRFKRVGTPGRDTRTFRDLTSQPGLTYAYRIRAVGNGTVSAYSTEVIVKVNADRR